MKLIRALAYKVYSRPQPEPNCDLVEDAMMRLRAAFLGIEECRWADLSGLEREAWIRVYTAARLEQWW